MHESTFEYLMPTEDQKQRMHRMRGAFGLLLGEVLANVPDGPDKTYLIRKLRECGMWANVAITRQPDGSPRA
jgi:hypothetical protein